jgi:hypothetical protein
MTQQVSLTAQEKIQLLQVAFLLLAERHAQKTALPAQPDWVLPAEK